jgi:aryl-alcohol dehydrogenase-like predicted oxidoreductase
MATCLQSPLHCKETVMADNPSAQASGQFSIGGDLTVNRLGFGAMRIVGKFLWGQPENPQAARETLRRLPELGVNLIDTADAYGPHVSEELIREVLHPYPADMLITTKGGNMRAGPRQWARNGSRAYLRQCVTDSLKKLGVEQIGLWQLHRIDPALPPDEQFATIAGMIQEGLIRHAGLSEVSVAELETAQKYFPVATVQNQYNLVDRKSEDVLAYCEARNIGFMPWAPLAAGSLAVPGSMLSAVAEKLNASPSQVALAWVLKRSRVMLPIPGTTNPDHLVQNVAAADLVLSDTDFAALDNQGRAAAQVA